MEIAFKAAIFAEEKYESDIDYTNIKVEDSYSGPTISEEKPITEEW
jgi:hypothetical protein